MTIVPKAGIEPTPSAGCRCGALPVELLRGRPFHMFIIFSWEAFKMTPGLFCSAPQLKN